MSGEIISGQRRLSRADLFDRSSRATSAFASLGVGPGDAVALMMRNDFAFLEASFALGALGAHAVPINWHFVADEARHILSDSNAKALVVHEDLLPQIADAVADDLPVVIVETPPEIAAAFDIQPAAHDWPRPRVEWDEWVRGFEPWTKPPQPSPGSMIYTSGTTGKPKGVKRDPASAEQIRTAVKIGEDVYGFTPSARGVLTGPLYHIAPNLYGVYIAALGDRLIMQARFDPIELLELIQHHRITTLNVVPTMFVRLLELPIDVRERYDLSSLRHVVHNAAPCPASVKKAMIDWLGPVVYEVYGGTESGPATACDSKEWLEHPGTVGRPVEGATIRILDDDGKSVPTGQIGDIYISSDMNSDFTYHGRTDERAEIENDGFITLGDIGYLDDDGYLFVSDRKKDMIISGGVNIYPAEIEAALITIDGIFDCAVFGIPDDDFGEVPMAVVQLSPGAQLDSESIRRDLRERLAKYKVPRTIEFASALPREDSGKIYKRLLRDPYWADRGSEI